ncbi:hypothetical protein MRS44_009305 [Fusarium solani]|uniref:uncharacterized protein n=1 Tax=Fusarium solani TaxID=169388 RepID=UPI0032C3E058|nr:hypothetical protein MRS44_009305 [Fusarium solani]
MVLIRQLERNFMGTFGIQWMPYLEAGTVAFGFSYSWKMNTATSQDEDETWPCPNSLDLVRAESHADVRLLGLDNPPRMSQRKRSNPALNVATFLVAAGVAQTDWTGHGTHRLLESPSGASILTTAGWLTSGAQLGGQEDQQAF